RFELETPVWLRRSDFAIAVLGQGSVHMDRAGNAIAASIEAARLPSWVSFYGKRFDLERAAITLDGGRVVNPLLDLRARHETGTEGALVLSLEGRLYDPTIALVSEQHPELSMAEALQLLVTGRTDASPSAGQTDLAQQAGSLAQSLVTGLTLGFVTSTIQSQVNWFPTLIVEPGTTSAGRYGAGVNLGPRFYLQATYGTVSSAVGLSTSGGAAGGEEFRALLEYAINAALNASVTTGYPMTGPQSGNVSVGADVYWSP
ncbi:MAG: translocation/assembly module TamB domain-containing protein, partial [Polyangiales bacterium]